MTAATPVTVTQSHSRQNSDPSTAVSTDGLHEEIPLQPQRQQGGKKSANNKFQVLGKSTAGLKKVAGTGVRGGFSLLNEFKTFISRGNVIDLAVGLVLGAAFTAIINSMVKDLMNPVLGLAMGGVDLNNLCVVLKPGNQTWYPTPQAAAADGAVTLNYGSFLQACLTFLIVSLCMFFLVRAVALLRHRKAPASNERNCPFCCSAIDKLATRCAFCTSQVERWEENQQPEPNDDCNVSVAEHHDSMDLEANLVKPEMRQTRTTSMP